VGKYSINKLNIVHLHCNWYTQTILLPANYTNIWTAKALLVSGTVRGRRQGATVFKHIHSIGLRRGSAAAVLLGLLVRILPAAWMSCLLWALCVVRYRSLRWSDHPSRGAYRVGCVWVRSWSVDNEEALAHWGLLCHGEKTTVLICDFSVVKVKYVKLMSVYCWTRGLG
jgi:hypothetical protein